MSSFRYSSLLLACVSGPALAQGSSATSTSAPAAPAAPPAAAAPASQADEAILVVADRGPQQAIDRKSYSIKPGPAAEAATGIDVMKDLPSVSVDAAGRIELLGNGNVRILIDGRPVPDALSVLRAMGAAQISRIEVMTNPPAQFSAEGTAGIINVITKRSSQDGLGGSITAGGDTRGSGIARIAPTWTQGQWTLSTSPTLFRGVSPTRTFLERDQVGAKTDPTLNRTEDGQGEQRSQGFGSRTQIVFRPDKKRSFSAALNTSAVKAASDFDNVVTPRAGGFIPFDQDLRTRSDITAVNGSLDYRAEGDKTGELLTVAVSGTQFDYDSRSRFTETARTGGGNAVLFVDNRVKDTSGTLKLDYATPLGTTRKLSLGGSIDWRNRRLTDRSLGGSLAGAPRNQATDIEGSYWEEAAYLTYQTQLGSWKVLPGIRAQARQYSLAGTTSDGPSRIDFFPSLFVERKLSKELTGVLSYSRRISWPDISDLSPVLRQQSTTFANQGNPNLKPETTDSFEARLSRAGKIHSFDLTLYNRITHDTFDRLLTANGAGLILSTPVNAGRRLDQGLEAAFRGRIAKPLRYSLTGNLTAVTRNVGTIGDRRRDAQYRGKLQLDYTDGKSADPGFDQLTFNLRYEGPVQQFQYHRDDFFDADLTWTHRLSRRLSVVTSALSLFGGTKFDSDTRTPFYTDRRFDRYGGRTVRLTLTYQLSAAPQPLPPPPAIPGAPSVP